MYFLTFFYSCIFLQNNNNIIKNFLLNGPNSCEDSVPFSQKKKKKKK